MPIDAVNDPSEMTWGFPDAVLKTAPSHTLNPAEWMYERLMSTIGDFEKTLDEEHEVGVRLVTFGAAMVLHIERLGYWGPDIITFHGVEMGTTNKVQLVQHLSQLSFSCRRFLRCRRSPVGLATTSRQKRRTPNSPTSD